MTRRAAAAGLVAAACLVMTACGVGMPDSGPVHATNARASNPDDEPARIDPPRPRKGASQEQIVRGFIDAMEQTPAVTTTVARQYLTKEAATTWQPKGMLVYGGVLPPRGTQQVEVSLVDAVRTDARGAWLGPASDAESTLTFPMELENGEWRIAQGPPHILVQGTWFTQRFKAASLYFFDPSARILVPEPVFVPRGVQFASALVDGLLEGPSNKLAGTEQSYFPAGVRSQVSVLVSDSGTARVDLTSDSEDAPVPEVRQTGLLVSQLAWTLGQDPTISRFKVTIDDRPLQLPGETEFSVTDGHQYAPYLAGSSTQLFGLQNGLLVAGSPQNLAPVSGPFGRTAYGLRTVAADLRADRVAGVSSDGHTLWRGKIKDTGNTPHTLTTAGEDLLRPAWDFSGRLWEVDRRSTGAVVYYARKHRLEPIEIRGISGKDVKHFLVSRDGSRLIAVIRESAEQDRIVVSRIQVNGNGQVAAALRARSITDPDKPEGQIRDIAWRSPTSIAILRQVSRSLFQVRGASVDGASPSGIDASPIPIDGVVTGLAGTSVPDGTLYAFEPAEDGAPASALVDVAGPRANRSDVNPGITMLSYAG